MPTDKECQVNVKTSVKRHCSLRRRINKTEMLLRQRNTELEALTENIPGGVHQCKCDDGLTFVSMSRSFLGLVGYTEEEIKKQFHNQFIEMVYQEDLPRIRCELKEQLSHSDTLAIEYRLRRKDGQLLWILDHAKCAVGTDGTKTFYCMLMDVTKQKEDSERLRLSLERHQVILNQTTDIIFEWDISADTLIFSANWKRKFGYDPIGENISTRIPLSQNIHPEDMQAFTKIMKEAVAGVPYTETEFRIRNRYGQYTWSRIRATIQFDHEGKPIKAVGVIIDISQEKREKQELLELAQHDALTGLYNKSAIRALAETWMQNREAVGYQALMIIDVDGFKAVNDTYGHLCGDSLLSDVAGVLKNSFRCTDLVGRIGGDEFLIYLPEVSGKETVQKRANSIMDSLHSIRPAKNSLPISCSMGVAIFPHGEIDYFTLYQCADQALYHRKHHGKGGIDFYDCSMCNESLAYGLAHSAIGSDIESDINAVDEKLAQYIFRMLYNAVTTETAINHILEIVGRAYDVSRVYIFESSEDRKRCSNTFEWCNVGVESEIAELQDLSYQDDLGNYLQNFDENGVFYCSDIRKLHPDLYGVLAPQGICSLLQCSIRDNGIFEGYVGFDECRESRMWTKDQIDSLTLIANVLSTFLVKLRLNEKLNRLEEKTSPEQM